MATWYGGIFGVTEYAYNLGLYNWLTQGVFWYSAYLIFAFLLVGRIRNTEARTMPELLGGMFGPRSERLGAWMNLFNVLPVTYVISLGIFLQLLFGGSLLVWMIAGTALVVAYSIFGGLRSVVYSDLVQFSVMCSSVVLVIFFSMRLHGGIGWLRQHPNIPAGHWRLFGEGIPLSATLVWGLIAMVVQIAAYGLVRVMIPNLSQRIASGEMSAALFLGAISLAAGILNASAMTF